MTLARAVGRQVRVELVSEVALLHKKLA